MEKVVLDKAALHKLKELDEPGCKRSIATELIDMFLSMVPNQIQMIQNAIKESDLAQAQREAHSLKSSSANLGVMELSKICRSLEHAQGLAEVEALFPKIVEEFKAAKVELEKALKFLEKSA